MLNNFIYAKTKALFEEQLNKGNVLDEAIVFIEDTKEIWNHGTYFACSDEIAKDFVITKGDVENSAVLSGNYNEYSNKAISQVSTSFGAASTAGLKGWYYTKVNLNTNSIWLSTDRLVNKIPIIGTVIGLKIETTTATEPDDKNFTCGWKVGDEVTIVNDKKYERCAKISSINGNMITLDRLPFTSETIYKSAPALGDFNEPDEFSITALKITDNETLKTRTLSSYDKGSVDFGGGAHAEGVQTYALNIGAHAEGIQTVAYGQYSHTEGFKTSAGYAAHAEGKENKAIGGYSHVEGELNEALSFNSHAEGYGTKAGNFDSFPVKGSEKDETGRYTHSEGRRTAAKGSGAHAEGYLTAAIGKNSHAEGEGTITKGRSSYSSGFNTLALANYSHAEGHSFRKFDPSYVENLGEIADIKSEIESDWDDKLARNVQSLEEGRFGAAIGDCSHIEGITCITLGNYSHAEGEATKAKGRASHAEGEKTVASGRDSHSEGYGTTASGYYSHAEGENTTASKISSHAEGSHTTASGGYSHSEGYKTEAIGNGAHAEGGFCINDDDAWALGGTASGDASHAEGSWTTATGESSHAEGNGTKAEGIYSHAEGDSTTASKVGAHAEGHQTAANGEYSHAEGSNTIAYAISSHAEGNGGIAIGNYSHTEGFGFRESSYVPTTDVENAWDTAEKNQDMNIQTGRFIAAVGKTSHAEGITTLALGDYSHAEGESAKANGRTSHAEGRDTRAIGNYSHAEGYSTEAKGSSSHVEGEKTVASGNTAHAEGQGTVEGTQIAKSMGTYYYYGAAGDKSHTEGTRTTTGHYVNGKLLDANSAHAEGFETVACATRAHAEGTYTVASSDSAHSEGRLTMASGQASHAEGFGTRAYNQGEHACGTYNNSIKKTSNNTTAESTKFSVGIGTSDNDRRNAFEIKENGDIYVNVGKSLKNLEKLLMRIAGVDVNIDVLYEGKKNPDSEYEYSENNFLIVTNGDESINTSFAVKLAVKYVYGYADTEGTYSNSSTKIITLENLSICDSRTLNLDNSYNILGFSNLELTILEVIHDDDDPYIINLIPGDFFTK